MRKELEAVRDPSNAEFVLKLCPGMERKRVLGLKAPVLRKFVRELERQDLTEMFLNDIPHRYLDEDLIHVQLISRKKSVETILERVEEFLPYMDNWMVTDALRPGIFKTDTELLEPRLETWIASTEPYTVRTAIGLYMSYFLDQAFHASQAERISDLRFDHYYVKMMCAWYMATALYKQPETAMTILKEERMDVWTHNKTIQKAIESYRITDSMKQELRSLRRK